MSGGVSFFKGKDCKTGNFCEYRKSTGSFPRRMLLPPGSSWSDAPGAAGISKIDMCFLDTVAENKEDRAFLAGMMVGKCKRIIVDVVVTREQRDILANLGVESMQGYFFSQALPARAFGPLLKRSGPVLAV